MKVFRYTTMLLLLFNGISALFGGYVLIDDPTGGGMQMPVELMKTGPFKDYLIPGIYLFSVLGVGSLAVLFMVIFHTRYHAQTVLLEGLATIAWIVTQMIVVQDIVLLQIVYLSVGAILVLCSLSLSNTR
ncbi:MAG: hypothetical protein H3C54_13980 [Taibaiella sp.]|nr:hypothetical protein [Taibaiella sp.]